jgi:hypothetical protein
MLSHKPASLDYESEQRDRPGVGWKAWLGLICSLLFIPTMMLPAFSVPHWAEGVGTLIWLISAVVAMVLGSRMKGRGEHCRYQGVSTAAYYLGVISAILFFAFVVMMRFV